MESLREHYALTLRRWVANLESAWARAATLAGPGRTRVWQLYMAASALAFEHNRIGVNQVVAVRTPDRGASGMPLRSRVWGEPPAPPDPHRREGPGSRAGGPALGAS